MIALGFACISLIFHIAQQSGMFEQATDRVIIDAFFQNAMFAWIAGIIISIGYFIIQNPLKYLCLLAPILSVIIYGLKLTFLSA